MKKKLLFGIILGLSVSMVNIADVFGTNLTVTEKKTDGQKNGYKKKTTHSRHHSGKNYIENNRKKKKLKTHIKITPPDYCPAFESYKSKPQAKRAKLLNKRR